MKNIKLMIRQAETGDFEQIAQLISQMGYPSSKKEFEDRMEGNLNDSSYECLVAVNDKIVVGLAGVSIGRYFEKSGLYCRLLILVADMSVARKGIGTKLVHSVEKWATRQGATAVIINSG